MTDQDAEPLGYAVTRGAERACGHTHADLQTALRCWELLGCGLELQVRTVSADADEEEELHELDGEDARQYHAAHVVSAPPRDAPVDFSNYHAVGFANFSVCELPEGEPYRISLSGSQYWHIDNTVVRFSDRWDGDCFGDEPPVESPWSLDGDVFPHRTWRSGKCRLTDFSRHKYVPIRRRLTVADKRLAKELLEAGGAVPVDAWEAKIPFFVTTLRVGFPKAGWLEQQPAPVQDLVTKHPRVRRIAYGDLAFLTRIADPATRAVVEWNAGPTRAKYPAG